VTFNTTPQETPMVTLQIRFFLCLLLVLAVGGLLSGCQSVGSSAAPPAYVQPY
jgi:hypothetical protein